MFRLNTNTKTPLYLAILLSKFDEVYEDDAEEDDLGNAGVGDSDDEYDEDKNTGCDCACKNDAKMGHTQATKVAKVYSPTDAIKTGIQEAINELLKN